MKKLIYSLLFLSFVACQNQHQVPYEEMQSQMILFETDSIKVEGELNDFKVAISNQSLEEGLHLVTVKLTSEQAAPPPQFTLKWHIPSIDIAKFWNPNLGVDKATYYSNRVTTSATRYAPVLSYLNTNDENRITIAVADALNPLTFGSYLKEEDANFHYYLVFFEEEYPAIKTYETQILIDRRKQYFGKSLSYVTDWWAQQVNYLCILPGIATIKI